jgi:hypothetical protein
MALASASFKIEMNAKRSGPLILASHPPASAKTRKDRITAVPVASQFFNSLLELVTAPTIDQLVCSG